MHGKAALLNISLTSVSATHHATTAQLKIQPQNEYDSVNSFVACNKVGFYYVSLWCNYL